MYLYYDERGILKEIIDDVPLRQNGTGVNAIYAYFEGNREITSCWYQLTKNTPIISTVNREATLVRGKTVPFSENRELKYFEYGKPYDFYKYTFVSDDLVANGWLKIIPFLMFADSSVAPQGEYIAMVNNGVVEPTDQISISEYYYLLSLINQGGNGATILNETFTELLNEDSQYELSGATCNAIVNWYVNHKEEDEAPILKVYDETNDEYVIFLLKNILANVNNAHDTEFHFVAWCSRYNNGLQHYEYRLEFLRDKVTTDYAEPQEVDIFVRNENEEDTLIDLSATSINYPTNAFYKDISTLFSASDVGVIANAKYPIIKLKVTGTPIYLTLKKIVKPSNIQTSIFYGEDKYYTYRLEFAFNVNNLNVVSANLYWLNKRILCSEDINDLPTSSAVIQITKETCNKIVAYYNIETDDEPPIIMVNDDDNSKTLYFYLKEEIEGDGGVVYFRFKADTERYEYTLEFYWDGETIIYEQNQTCDLFVKDKALANVVASNNTDKAVNGKAVYDWYSEIIDIGTLTLNNLQQASVHITSTQFNKLTDVSKRLRLKCKIGTTEYILTYMSDNTRDGAYYFFNGTRYQVIADVAHPVSSVYVIKVELREPLKDVVSQTVVSGNVVELFNSDGNTIYPETDYDAISGATTYSVNTNLASSDYYEDITDDDYTALETDNNTLARIVINDTTYKKVVLTRSIYLTSNLGYCFIGNSTSGDIILAELIGHITPTKKLKIRLIDREEISSINKSSVNFALTDFDASGIYTGASTLIDSSISEIFTNSSQFKYLIVSLGGKKVFFQNERAGYTPMTGYDTREYYYYDRNYLYTFTFIKSSGFSPSTSNTSFALTRQQIKFNAIERYDNSFNPKSEYSLPPSVAKQLTQTTCQEFLDKMSSSEYVRNDEYLCALVCVRKGQGGYSNHWYFTYGYDNGTTSTEGYNLFFDIDTANYTVLMEKYEL